MILIFFFFSVKILYRTKFSFQPKLAGMAGMTRNMPKFSFFSSLLACRKRRSRVEAVSEPCRRRVGACRRNEKKERKRTLAGHRNPASRTRSGVRHVSDIDTTPKMACPCNLAKPLVFQFVSKFPCVFVLLRFMIENLFTMA